MKIRRWSLVINFIVCFLILNMTDARAQDSAQLTRLSQQIIEAKTIEETFPAFQELTDMYSGNHAYNEYVAFLTSLKNKKQSLEPVTQYYIGLTRYLQLNYLQEKQLWEEYFNQGASYRDEATEVLTKTIASLPSGDAVRLYSQLLLWKFYRDQQDTREQDALSQLMSEVMRYAQGSSRNLLPLEETAQALLDAQEKARAQEVYRLYVKMLLSSAVSDDELKGFAQKFYEQGSLDLSETLFEAYVDRLALAQTKEQVSPRLIEIAKKFSFGALDPKKIDAVFAEKIFQKLEKIGGKEVFDETLTYLRAFNLEKNKEYMAARDMYQDLLQRFPGSSHAHEALFKVGMISTYSAADPDAGKGLFQKLASESSSTAHTIAALYQLGLLNQFQDNGAQAKEYYTAALAQIDTLKQKSNGASFDETATLARQRMKEIDDKTGLDYNVKMFLEACLSQQPRAAAVSSVDLQAQPSLSRLGETIMVVSGAQAPESGCFDAQVQYLWSGHVGVTQPEVDDASFETSYSSSGTKEINLVVLSSGQVIDHSFIMLDLP
ncbi:MAG: hypothetical protein KBA46_02425 [Candidatus Omnitrophica bacterium]|nr:hypothetical protein [Candidatus Omnitrophota bacterium]